MDEQLAFVHLIATRLDDADIPYMVTGSMALAVYAVPRMTRDIDLVVEYRPQDAVRLADLFAGDCYVDTDSVRQAADQRGMFNIIHNEWLIKADFIVRKDEAYRKTEFARRCQIEIGGMPIAVVAPEDLVLSKLHWAKDSASELQQRDVRQILESVTDLDMSYIEKWAIELGVDELLQKARTS